MQTSPPILAQTSPSGFLQTSLHIVTRPATAPVLPEERNPNQVEVAGSMYTGRKARWRKYGNKPSKDGLVKSYFFCTHPECPAKTIVSRLPDQVSLALLPQCVHIVFTTTARQTCSDVEPCTCWWCLYYTASAVSCVLPVFYSSLRKDQLSSRLVTAIPKQNTRWCSLLTSQGNNGLLANLLVMAVCLRSKRQQQNLAV